ncbi:MAG: GAF domain-containing protein [Ramlibacter sp.]
MSQDLLAPQRDVEVERAGRWVDEQIAKGAPLREMLAGLATAAEQIAGEGCVASILLLDDEGLLRNAASPNLPADYPDAIDRLRPDPGLGTCAAAAATGEIVLTPDFESDDKWAELKHLPLSIGYRAAWSMPIKNQRGRVLGTFGTYYPDRRSPTPQEIEAVARLVALAARALAARSIEPESCT